MTKKQAIEELRFNKVDDTYLISGDALDMAIKALENQKIGHWKICAETIHCFNFTLGDFTETEYHCKCSECGTEIIPEESMYFQFCPICGTKMEGDRRMTEIERMQAFSYLDGAADGLKEARNDVIEELEKIIDKIDFEENWLINIKMENGFISIPNIRIAMYRIRKVVSELKKENLMSLKDKMANAKEVDLFEDLTQEEKIEAIVEGRLQVAMIKELEKLKEDILNLGFRGWADKPKLDREEVLTILDKHISELKGENK